MSETPTDMQRALAAVKDDPALQLALLKISQYGEFLSFVADNNMTIQDRLISIIRECCIEGDKLGYSRAMLRTEITPFKNPFTPSEEESPTEPSQTLTEPSNEEGEEE